MNLKWMHSTACLGHYADSYCQWMSYSKLPELCVKLTGSFQFFVALRWTGRKFDEYDQHEQHHHHLSPRLRAPSSSKDFRAIRSTACIVWDLDFHEKNGQICCYTIKYIGESWGELLNIIIIRPLRDFSINLLAASGAAKGGERVRLPPPPKKCVVSYSFKSNEIKALGQIRNTA